MFENAPNNLPVEDILDTVEPAPAPQAPPPPPPRTVTPPPPRPPAAGGATDIQRPTPFRPIQSGAAVPNPQALASLEEPRAGFQRVLLFGGIGLAVLLILGGVVWLTLRRVNGPVTTNTNLPSNLNANTNLNTNVPVNTNVNAALNTNVNTVVPPVNVPLPPANTNANVNANLNANVPVNTNAPVPSADTDGDGLRDSEERTLGTNPAKSDTDADELSDWDEVRVYRTDPLNADTDGDTYADGAEVSNGYSPTGPGRLKPPTPSNNNSNANTNLPAGQAGTP